MNFIFFIKKKLIIMFIKRLTLTVSVNPCLLKQMETHGFDEDRHRQLSCIKILY